jgi:hypothetical protein
LNIKIVISLSSLGLNIVTFGHVFVLSGIFYDLYWPGLVLLLPCYFLVIKVFSYWEVRIDSHYFYLKRLLFKNLQIDILNFKSYEIQKVLFFDRFKIHFRDGTTYKFIGIPQFFLKENYSGTLTKLLDDLIEDNYQKNSEQPL